MVCVLVALCQIFNCVGTYVRELSSSLYLFSLSPRSYECNRCSCLWAERLNELDFTDGIKAEGGVCSSSSLSCFYKFPSVCVWTCLNCCLCTATGLLCAPYDQFKLPVGNWKVVSGIRLVNVLVETSLY